MVYHKLPNIEKVLSMFGTKDYVVQDALIIKVENLVFFNTQQIELKINREKISLSISSRESYKCSSLYTLGYCIYYWNT